MFDDNKEIRGDECCVSCFLALPCPGKSFNFQKWQSFRPSFNFIRDKKMILTAREPLESRNLSLQSLWPPVGHRAALMKPFHMSLFFATACASPHDRPISFNSFSIVFLQVVFGLPLFLFPAGVHLRATLGILSGDIRRKAIKQYRFNVAVVNAHFGPKAVILRLPEAEILVLFYANSLLKLRKHKKK